MDDYVRDVFNGEAQKRDAVSLAKYHWPTRTIHYEFDPDISNIHFHIKNTIPIIYSLEKCLSELKFRVLSNSLNKFVHYH